MHSSLSSLQLSSWYKTPFKTQPQTSGASPVVFSPIFWILHFLTSLKIHATLLNNNNRLRDLNSSILQLQNPGKISSSHTFTAFLALPCEAAKTYQYYQWAVSCNFPQLTELKHHIFLQGAVLRLINVWKIFEDEDQYQSAIFRNPVTESNSRFDSCEASDWSQVHSLTFVIIFVVNMNYSRFTKHFWHKKNTHFFSTSSLHDLYPVLKYLSNYPRK